MSNLAYTNYSANPCAENVLKNFAAMTGYCRGHSGEISGGWVQNYGYIVEAENYRYCLRCNPAPGDYQGKLIGLPQNRLLCDRSGRVYDIICGTFFLAGLGAEDFISLTDAEIGKYSFYFRI